MKLSEFNVGDKVHVPDGVMEGARYSTVRGKGTKEVFLESEDGSEFVTSAERTDFSYWYPTPPKEELLMLEKRIEELKIIGDELAAAIKGAAWDNELTGPTFHMRWAVEQWMEATRK